MSRNWRRLRNAFGVSLALVAPALAQTGELAFTDCAQEIEVTGAQCTRVEVFEDRAAAEGRVIRLNVAVLPALGTDPKPDPLFLLNGGPGGAATALATLAKVQLRRIREDREIVLVDQRGTGDSNPLDCNDVDADSTYFQLGDFPYQVLQDCLAGLDADPRLYTTSIAADDLDDVRAALGYEQINLWGGSYGTRAALVYLRRHEPRVRSVILDGLAPPAIRLPLHVGEDAQRAMNKVFEHCEAAVDCARAFPALRSKYDELVARLETPETVVETHPRTGQSVEIPVTRDGVVLLLRMALYDADATRLLPLIIDRAHAGDYAPIMALADPMNDAVSEQMSIGLLFSVLCAEDMAFIDDDERASIANEPFLGSYVLDTWGGVCDFWPRAEVPAAYHDPVVSDKPVLLLSGDLDPVTPPRWGDMTAEHLSNSLHVVVPGAAHGTAAFGCVQRAMRQFLDDASVDNLDVTCVDDIQRPQFFHSFTGPHVGEQP